MKYTIKIQKLIFMAAFLLSFGSFAQQYELQCTMTDRQILQSQTFNEDDPQAESARGLLESLLTDLNFFYLKLNEGETLQAQDRIPVIMLKFEEAEVLNLNFSMLNADKEFIEQNY